MGFPKNRLTATKFISRHARTILSSTKFRSQRPPRATQTTVWRLSPPDRHPIASPRRRQLLTRQLATTTWAARTAQNTKMCALTSSIEWYSFYLRAAAVACAVVDFVKKSRVSLGLYERCTTRDVYHSIGNLTGYPAVYVACRASLMWAPTYPRLFRVFGRGGRHGCPVQTGYIPFDRKSYALSNDIYNLGCAAAWRLLGGVRTSELTLSFLQLTLDFSQTYPIFFPNLPYTF